MSGVSNSKREYGRGASATSRSTVADGAAKRRSTEARGGPASVISSVAGLCVCCIMLLACSTGGLSSGSGEVSLYNAYWNCPTASPVPTECSHDPAAPTAGSGTATATPEIECSTPLPTATPYGLQMMPDERTTSTFYQGQQVRVGPLRILLAGYSALPIPTGAPRAQGARGGPGGNAGDGHAEQDGEAGEVREDGEDGEDGEVGEDDRPYSHVWTFEVANEGSEPLTITWPVHILMREVVHETGEVEAGRWGYTERAASAAGAIWQSGMSVLPPGRASTIRLPVEAPEGRGLAVGFAPDLSSADLRYDAGSASNIIWFRPASDPYCLDNTSGPVTRSDQGGAVWQMPLSTRPPMEAGRFTEWPVERGTYVSQDFGCTDFPEIAGYDCPNARPWFHAGVDFVDKQGTPLRAVAEGVVEFVGVSQGVRCTFPGAQEPRTNLGWVVVVRSGPYTIKYGHTMLGSERVRAGERVTPGQVLALMGSTGCSTGPHLHFQVQRADGSFVDPFNLLAVNNEP